MSIRSLSNSLMRSFGVTASHSLSARGPSSSNSDRIAVKASERFGVARRAGLFSGGSPFYSLRFSGNPQLAFKRGYSSSIPCGGSEQKISDVSKKAIGTDRVDSSHPNLREDAPMKKLPIGIQSIRKVIEDGYVYVDKTGFAEQLIEGDAQHYFVSRPRRFGKSMFLDTLREIFKGNKELFAGHQIARGGYEWKQHPVIFLDFSKLVSSTTEELEADLKATLARIGESHGIRVEGPSTKFQLGVLVEELAKKERVVVLVDEYDKPIVDQLDRPQVARSNRDVLKGFFETLKSLDSQLRFTFTTGVSKFSQVSLFSGPNNLRDLTMDPSCAGMMGYTEGELVQNFGAHIQAIAEAAPQKKEQSEVLEQIRYWYNGYRFSESEVCVYNPFSTLNFLKDNKPKAYWYSSGTPSFLIDELKKHPRSMVSLDGTSATEEELMDISSLEKIDIKALMYQTGYFTIQGYNPIAKRYQLGMPNEEVRTAFINSLVKNFAPISSIRSSEKLIRALENHDLGPIFTYVEVGLSGFPYQVFTNAKERTYQGMLISILYGMGFDPLSERIINDGRIDVIFEMQHTTYILELKLNRSADEALEQIQTKRYFKPYTHKGKQIVIVGANFSSKHRNIDEWKGELLSDSGEKLVGLLPSKKK